MSEELPRLPGFRESALRRRQETVGSLADHRRQAGLSQTEVAARMGTSQSTVARLEAGEVDPRLSTLDRYAQALGGQLQVEVRFGFGFEATRPTVTELPISVNTPATESPGAKPPGPGRPQIEPEHFRPAAQLSPPTVAKPAAGPPERRW
jgi:transcriptional regulator with XRE-family HTH domain